MRKKIWRVVLTLFIGYIVFSFWMSPRLGGIISMGKEGPSQTVEELEFSTESSNNYSLTYADLSDSEFSKELISTYKLDSIVAESTSDFEKVVKIQSWVQSRWDHDGGNMAAKSDALYILEQAQKGEKFRCVEYSIVAGQCLSALGFRTRNLGLMTKDISEVKSGGGHAVNEVYLSDLKKWILIDPQFDVITTKDGVPLNAVELQALIARGEEFEILNPNGIITKEKYEQWIGPYLYYFKVSLNKGSISIWDRIVGNKKQLTLYPLSAERPAYFQKIFRLNNSYYTHSLSDFYPILD